MVSIGSRRKQIFISMSTFGDGWEGVALVMEGFKLGDGWVRWFAGRHRVEVPVKAILTVVSRLCWGSRDIQNSGFTACASACL